MIIVMRGALVIATGLLLCAAGTLAAASYPDRPIRIIVAFPPGASTDVISRIVGQKVTENWGQNVIIENRGGAGGNIGAQLAARATPDGYTLLATSVAFPEQFAKTLKAEVEKYAKVVKDSGARAD